MPLLCILECESEKKSRASLNEPYHASPPISLIFAISLNIRDLGPILR